MDKFIDHIERKIHYDLELLTSIMGAYRDCNNLPKVEEYFGIICEKKLPADNSTFTILIQAIAAEVKAYRIFWDFSEFFLYFF